jgi:hypothetical protein
MHVVNLRSEMLLVEDGSTLLVLRRCSTIERGCCASRLRRWTPARRGLGRGLARFMVLPPAYGTLPATPLHKELTPGGQVEPAWP